MRNSIPFLAIGALIMSASAAHAKSDPEAEIARMTKGRTAGDAVDCIRQHEINSSRIVGRTAIVYTMNNGTIYVNRPASGANFLSRDDVLVTDTHSDRLCNVDIVRLVDSGTHMPTGSVGLGQFVPYAKPGSTAAD